MSFEELQKWRLYDAETPIDDIHTHHLPSATTSAVLANCHRDPKKRRDPYTADDFLPPWKELGDVGTPVSAQELTEKLRQVQDLNNNY
ncbi:phage tail assembly protein T [Dokdonella sp. MW10]|uniref:phage tail assembly protein T n=1 Tax=Dokdonella sp. MW10 TaxID=2992926 RepID=UPI003F7DA9A2